MCAKTKLHTVNDVCKNCNRRNKIAHVSLSVQKFGVFMNFANNTLQMMKEMMFLRDKIMEIEKYTLQIKVEKPFAKTSSFVI